MERPSFQISVGAMLGVVGCLTINVWLFRIGVLWGILGLNVTKHVVVAYLCQVLGVDRRTSEETPSEGSMRSPHLPVS